MKKTNKQRKPHPYVVALIASAPAWAALIVDVAIKLMS